MKLNIPTVSVSADNLADAIASAEHGVLMLKDLPAVPYSELRSTFDYLASPAGTDVGKRLNDAYTNNLVYKDSFASGNGGPTVDMKRVLDLSPDRLAKIESVDPDVVALARTGSLGATLGFWEGLQASVVPNLLRAVADATGSDDVVSDAATNYRMVDYYARPASSAPPRCGDHRDFGTFTLVFASEAGLEIFADGDGTWQAVGPIPTGSALLLFGWCTQIRSNGRIPAALHRVVDCPPGPDGLVPRRTSAVLFVAPKQVGTRLEPVVRDGEERKYVSGVKVGMLRGGMARKWRHREGTLSAEDKVLEEEEILATKMKTQDDVVKRSVAV